MTANGTVLVAGADTRHGRAYTLAFFAGGYRVGALVAAASTGRPGQAGQAARAAALGAEPVAADPSDAAALRRLLKGVDAVVIALDGRGVEGRTAEERTTRALVDAAAAERVAILYSSLLHAEWQTGVPALDLKGRLELVARRSGAPVTILRPGMLMDVFDDPGMRERATSDGVLASAIAVDAPVSYLAADDLGLLAVLALEIFGRAGATLDLGGPEALTFRELIPRLWGMTGHSVTYEQLPLDEVRARSGQEEALLVQHVNGAGYAVDMRQLLERAPLHLTTVTDYLAARDWERRAERVAA
jgi:NAD(P)H dehydrogenase (quinone)